MPWFSRNSVPSTVWVAIIEKAYAKLKGSYGAIDLGHAREAMVDLSGGVMTERLRLEGAHSGLSSAAVFEIIHRALNGGMVLTCGIAGQVEAYVDDGLYASHSYSILRAEEEVLRNRVKLRNPWGHTGEVELDEDEEDGVFWQSVVRDSLASQMRECAELS